MKTLIINQKEVVDKLLDALKRYKKGELDEENVIWLIFKLLTVQIRQEQQNGNIPSTGNSGQSTP